MTAEEKAGIEKVYDLLCQYRHTFLNVARGDKTSADALITCASHSAEEFMEAMRPLYHLLHPEYPLRPEPVDAPKFTKTQEKQLDFLSTKESNETLGWTYNYSVDCKDCGEGNVYHSADGAKTFIKRHVGHRTWVQDMGKVNPLTSR